MHQQSELNDIIDVVEGNRLNHGRISEETQMNKLNWNWIENQGGHREGRSEQGSVAWNLLKN